MPLPSSLPSMDASLATFTLNLKAALAKAAASGELGHAAAEAYGYLSLPESLWELQQDWAAQRFSSFPSITLAPGSAMPTARGAYVIETNAILLNEDWLASAKSSEVIAVLLEEVGHHLDARFNSFDTAGDEGELFSRVLLGQLPSDVEYSRIVQENDAIQVTLANGQVVWAEAAETIDAVVKVTGTAKSETFVGGSNDDSLFGMGGNDELVGGAGKDYLDGGVGNDTMAGGLGDDIYVVDSTSDVVTELSSQGKDSILSTVSLALPDNVENLDLRTNGKAVATGNSLDNVIYGGFDDTHIFGGEGNDSLYGRGTSKDFLEGGLGNDYLDGGLGSDVMDGGLGNDTYVVRDESDVVIEQEQGGSDWVYATTSFALSDNVENIQLFGSADGLRITGNKLNNTLVGDNFANILSGGEGNDYLNGGASADQMIGGVGNDTYVVDNASDVIVENAGEGADWVIATIDQTLAQNVENLDLRGTENLSGIGNAADNIIRGNLGNSILFGGAGNDSLYGRGSGNDRLDGGDGNDYLDGGLGSDVMLGGSGNDTFVVDNAGDIVVEETGAGSDWVIADLSYTLGDNIDGLSLRGKSGFEELDGSGNGLDNTIIGNSGRNTIMGEAGNDILNGGAGEDVLFGGEGNDIFVLSNKESNGSIAVDRVSDFQSGKDILYVSRSMLNMDTTKVGAGVLSPADFVVVNSSTEGGLEGSNGLGSTAKFVLDQSMGILYYNSNGAEQGAGEFSAGIAQVLGDELKASDILLS